MSSFLRRNHHVCTAARCTPQQHTWTREELLAQLEDVYQAFPKLRTHTRTCCGHDDPELTSEEAHAFDTEVEWARYLLGEEA